MYISYYSCQLGRKIHRSM